MTLELHVFIVPKSLLQRLEQKSLEIGKGEDEIFASILSQYLRKKRNPLIVGQTNLRGIEV